MSEIPGTTAKHRWITDACRRNKGDAKAVQEALVDIHEEALRCLSGWPADRGTRFHFVLTVERAGSTPGGESAE